MKQNSNGKQQNQHKSTNSTHKRSNGHGKAQNARNVRREQPRKDSKTKRVNFDNTREDKVQKRIMEDAHSGKYNDINDFLKNPTLVRAAASIPVAPILGRNVGHLDPVPGIMVFPWQPNFGNYGSGAAYKYAPEASSGLQLSPYPFALNQAADTTYSYLVHANSRNYSYNSSDLFLLIMAGSQVFAVIEALKRAYGIVKRYVETSAYTPKSELAAMGFDWDDLVRNFSHLWFDINLLISQSRQIWIPTTFPFVSRWQDLNSMIYKDADGPYAQEYIFVQSKYYRYTETGAKTGGALIQAGYSFVNSSGEQQSGLISPGQTNTDGQFVTWTWEQWISMATNMIQYLIASEDRGIIYGDLLNAFGADRIVAVPEIASDYSIEAVYSPEISMQIENLTIWGAKLPDMWGQIENRIVPMITTAPPSGIARLDHTRDNWSLNFHVNDQPTPEMFLLATRFMTMGMRAVAIPQWDKTTGEFSAAAMWLPDTAGSEIVTDIYVMARPTDTSTNSVMWLNQYWGNGFGVDKAHYYAMAFDWHPFLAVGVTTGAQVSSPTTAQANEGARFEGNFVDMTVGDYDRYAEIIWSEVQRIHDVCFLSLYDVPSSLT